MSHGMISIGPNYAQLAALGSANGSEECSGVPQSPYLGVEEMMVLLETRLGRLDDEVKEMMDGQQHRMEQRDAVKAFANELGRTKDMNAEKWKELRPKLEEQIEKLPVGDPARVELEEKLAALDAKVGFSEADKARMAKYDAVANDPSKSQEVRMANAAAKQAIVRSKKIDETAWKADKADIDQVYDNLGDAAEMEMLKLQSHMTKRTTLVQLTTNIVQKLEAAPDMIAKNI